MAETFGQRFDQHTNDIIEATELLKELSDREGQYVWKKYEQQLVERLDLQVNVVSSSSSTVFTVSAINGILPEIDANFFVGCVMDVNIGGSHFILTFNANGSLSYSGAANGTSTWSYNTATKQLTAVVGGGTFVVNSAYVPNRECLIFIDYVVSDDETAYPNGGILDGYLYELLSNPVDLAKELDLIPANIRQGIDIFGVLGTMSEGLTPAMLDCTRMAVDEFTFSSNTSGGVELSHSLGIVPKFAIVFAKTLPSIYANVIARASVVINANNRVCYWSIAIKNGSDWSLGSGDSGSATTTKLSEISSSRIYQGGIKYGLITFG